MRRNRRQQGGAADGTERACAANGKWSRLGMMTNAFRLMKWLEFEPDKPTKRKTLSTDSGLRKGTNDRLDTERRRLFLLH